MIISSLVTVSYMRVPNEIPVAQRVSDPQRISNPSHPIVKSLRVFPWWGYVLAILAFLAPVIAARAMFVWNGINEPQTTKNAPSSGTATTEPNPIIAPTDLPTSVPATPANGTSSSSNSSTSNANPNSTPSANNSSMLGHLRYSEAPANTLRPIGRASDGYEIKLREAAAKSYLAMVADARAEGVELVVISGFRTKAEQKELFFGVGQQRNQTPAQRAQVSAPPGYSEHHTGYAVDIGDGSTPSTNLSRNFEKTAAFAWLQKNAARYGFEISFPENNPQGVMYEPWHWRYVGDDHSLATFYKGQGLPPKN